MTNFIIYSPQATTAPSACGTWRPSSACRRSRRIGRSLTSQSSTWPSTRPWPSQRAPGQTRWPRSLCVEELQENRKVPDELRRIFILEKVFTSLKELYSEKLAHKIFQNFCSGKVLNELRIIFILEKFSQALNIYSEKFAQEFFLEFLFQKCFSQAWNHFESEKVLHKLRIIF